MQFYYIHVDTDEIPGALYKKVISSSCLVKILFLSFTCEDIGVVKATKMISQKQVSKVKVKSLYEQSGTSEPELILVSLA